MSLWHVLARRILPFGDPGLTAERRARLHDLKALEPAEMDAALNDLSPAEQKELARIVLRERVDEAIETLRACATCRELLSRGGYDPIALLAEFRQNIGRAFWAQMDIDPQGLGGAQRGAGYNTWIRFGPREFLTGIGLPGLTIRESQVQVILHELGHAIGALPADGHDGRESLRNQERIARACLPAGYARITGQKAEDLSRHSEQFFF